MTRHRLIIMIGYVKWFNNKKGHGFITGEDGNSTFVHHSEINMDGFKALYPGQKVSYDVIETEYGVQAGNVKVVQDPVD